MAEPSTNELFDVPLEAFVADPYPYYRRLREKAPVCWHARTSSWIVTGYADVAAMLRDPRFVAQKSFFTRPELSALQRTVERWMTQYDPPQHTRLRGLVSKAFTPRVVEGVASHVERITGELLDQASVAGSMDVVRDLAFPLPVKVIALMLGVPADRHDDFRRWSEAIAVLSEPPDVATAEALGHATRAIVEFEGFFRELVAAKRRAPGDDLLSGLVAAEERGDRLTLDELLANAIFLLFAGHETTVNLIGNGVHALLRHPDQLALLRRRPELIDTAVEELLRFESPIQASPRVLGEDVTWGDQTLRRGDLVSLVQGAANRDPAQFADPDRLDVARADNRHLAFGAGIHYCVGAPLSRLEAKIAISALLRRMPGLRLAGEAPRWRPLVTWRGLERLPVAF